MALIALACIVALLRMSVNARIVIAGEAALERFPF
jgi:hypothetical protein